MGERMTIGEFAKLKGITPETLRHYDRAGLLKPAFTDPATGYRYYSIFQYETLSTILELRQLGMTLPEIRDFLGERNVRNTLELLKKRHRDLREEIERLIRLEERIAGKIGHLEAYACADPRREPVVRAIPERRILLWKKDLNDHMAEYGFSQLESQIKEFAPIFAENRYGMKISLDRESGGFKETFLFLTAGEGTEGDAGSAVAAETLPAGEYLCAFQKGRREGLGGYLEEFSQAFPRLRGRMRDYVVLIAQIDLSVVGEEEKMLYEIQIPLEKA